MVLLVQTVLSLRLAVTFCVRRCLSGFLPTTVLGKVQSPDMDDWGQKVYSFQGTPPR